MNVNNIRNIVIIFTGELHHDPAPIGLMKEYIIKFHELRIPQIYCSEHSQDQTLKEKKANDLYAISENEKYVNELITLTKRIDSLAFPYFALNTPIEAKLLKSNTASKEEAYVISRRIINYINHIENMGIDDLLEKLKIPYQGIERKYSEHKEFTLKLAAASNSTSATNNFLSLQEIIRIEGMVQTLFAKSLPLLKEMSGIIWVNCGIAHIHNLATATLKHIQNNSLTTHHSFTLLPIACFSKYTELKKLDVQNIMNFSRKPFKETQYNDLFGKTSVYFVDDIIENGKHVYESKEFAKLMEFAKDFFKKI